jgi:membrane fusion protein (multidrug efflux system)
MSVPSRHPILRHPGLRRFVGSLLLLGSVAGAGLGLASWKAGSLAAADAAAATQPEHMETVTAAVAAPRTHVRSTTAIGTVLALRSITLSNEVPGTVREVALVPGQIVEEGAVLVAFDVAVEEAELRAQEAEARQAELLFGRTNAALASSGASAADVDRARAANEVATANVERIKALIERKRIRAPFRARVGLADVHPGQYLEAGAELTTLQGVDDAVHIDFTVAQDVAAALRVGDLVDVVVDAASPSHGAELVAIDARVDALTRTALLRARLSDVPRLPSPGASIRVRVPLGAPIEATAVPVTALRKGPQGEHVFVLVEDAEPGKDAEKPTRASLRKVVSGPIVGDEVLVLEHLEPGERVAASGSFKLREGALVNVVEPDNSTASR